MFGQDFRKKCTRETEGTLITKIEKEGVWYISVGYTINGVGYVCKEALLNSAQKAAKIGRRPLAGGVKTETVSLENAQMGEDIRLKYNPKNPKQSYLPDNAD